MARDRFAIEVTRIAGRRAGYGLWRRQKRGFGMLFWFIIIVTLFAIGDVVFGQEAPLPVPSADGQVTLYFADGSETLDERAQGTLDAAAKLYDRVHPHLMIVSGYTDATGDTLNNLWLSSKRAMTVTRLLVKLGVPPQFLQIRAYGLTEPLFPRRQGITEWRDRVVTISWRVRG